MATSKHTLVALVEDKPGVLNRVASLLFNSMTPYSTPGESVPATTMIRVSGCQGDFKQATV